MDNDDNLLYHGEGYSMGTMPQRYELAPGPMSLDKLLAPPAPNTPALFFASFLASELNDSGSPLDISTAPRAVPALLPYPGHINAIAGPSNQQYWPSGPDLVIDETVPFPDLGSSKRPASEVDELLGAAPRKQRRSQSHPSQRPNRPTGEPIEYTHRTFPVGAVTILPTLPRLYRQFPLSSAFSPASYVLAGFENDPDTQRVAMPLPEGGEGDRVVAWNKGVENEPFDLYKAKFVRGHKAVDKEGMCPICVEPVERGGEGVQKWLRLKSSQYLYHLNFYHGISNRTRGLPFSPPTQHRRVPIERSTMHSRPEMLEGLCHRCQVWIPLQSNKGIETAIPELFWWKHAKACHGDSVIEGAGGYYIEDEVWQLATDRRA